MGVQGEAEEGGMPGSVPLLLWARRNVTRNDERDGHLRVVRLIARWEVVGELSRPLNAIPAGVDWDGFRREGRRGRAESRPYRRSLPRQPR